MLSDSDEQGTSYFTNIAVIGLSCKFPGANTPEAFWNNLVNGIDTISRFTKEELKAEGIPDDLLDNPNYVRARGILQDIEKFDANFFGYNPTDAKATDPQQRLFLECAWEALESAGYSSEKCKELIGVYASMADSTYLQNNLLKNKNQLQTFDWLQTRIGTSLATLGTQVSYRLNLKGPSVNITTACSSALVAIASACRGLVDYECDIALAGAAAVAVPRKQGYLFQEGGIESPDGYCKAFDADSKGTVFSDGLGVVVLKRLKDALEDNDTVYAVIKGWSVNNDGADKIGFTAPSVNGQASCIASALTFANISSDTIGYIEAHGTGTELGDAIELNAFIKAFTKRNENKQYCAIGSVKTNIGHLDIAAGMASFIKAVFSLKNHVIPATLHYQKPNQKVDLQNTPFYVNSECKKWDQEAYPRRAGVNASGIGGTNAFLVLEEFIQPKIEKSSRKNHLIMLSAKTKNALEQQTQNLIHFTEEYSTNIDLADLEFTLQVGRTDFNYRRAFVCKNMQDVSSILKKPLERSVLNGVYKNDVIPKTVFMFSGQGAQYVGMGYGLYHSEPKFASLIEEACCYLDESIREAVYRLIVQSSKSNEEISNTLIVQPALFIIEYALVQFLVYLGVKPDAMIGHSLGEYVAACVGGSINLKDALKLICHRARLMATVSPGLMLAINSDETTVLQFLKDGNVSLAAVNSPSNCVVSGNPKVIHELEGKLNQQGVMTRILKTSHAFHSEMMDPILSQFREIVGEVDFKIPNIPFVSNLTGNWITNEEVIDPEYWVKHLRYTVKFLHGLRTLVQDKYSFFLEIGPGKVLSDLARDLIKKNSEICVQNILPALKNDVEDQEHFLSGLGHLWLSGVKINWNNYYEYEKRQRVPLPAYPFESKTYWIEPDPEESFKLDKKQPFNKWFYEPSWVRSFIQNSQTLSIKDFSKQHCWIIFWDTEKLGENISRTLSDFGQVVINVKSGQTFQQLNNSEYIINSEQKEDYTRLVMEITRATDLHLRIINLFSLTLEHDLTHLDLLEIKKTTALSFYSILFFTQALIEQKFSKNVSVTLVGNEMFSVVGGENIYPAKALAIGPCRVIPREHPNFKVQILDLLMSDLDKSNMLMIAKQIIQELLNEEFGNDNIIAYRGQFRWSQSFKTLQLNQNDSRMLQDGGVYLFTGGLGGISATIAKYIARSCQKPRFILISRVIFPDEKDWQAWLENHGKHDTFSKRILQLLEIKRLGAEIEVVSADISCLDQCQKIIDRIKKIYGVINGVIHAAGVPGGGLVQLKTPEMAEKVFAPKVTGTYILTYLLRNELLDFFLLCSSISSVIGEVSQVDYCAANACLDAFPFTNIFKNKTFFSTINWNTWREIGMAVETERPENIPDLDNNNDISPEEGANIFSQVIAHSYKQAIISVYDINAFISSVDHNMEVVPSSGSVKREEFFKDSDDNFLLPTKKIEFELVNMWQDLLGIENVNIHDNFAMQGGHSLMALRLLTAIEKKFKVKISLPVVLENNIEVLAKEIEVSLLNKEKFSSSIVPIRLAGRESPLFCFHPVGGTVLCYVNLAKVLQFDCPIYGLQDPSIEHGKLLFTSLEEMAGSYIQAIQQIQKHGPYFLCGLSFGATLAVEVAKQLRSKGETVNPLLLFDGWAKFSDVQRMENLFKEAILREKNDISNDKNFVELSWERMKLLLNYQMPKVEDRLILFKAQELLPEYIGIDQPYNYWDLYAKGNIEVYKIPGDHESILAEPGISVLTKKLDSILLMERDELDVGVLS